MSFQAIIDAVTFFDVIVAIMAIAVIILGLLITTIGVLWVLEFIRGLPISQTKPPKGYEYEFVDKDGKAEYSTWSKKDDYYYNKTRR